MGWGRQGGPERLAADGSSHQPGTGHSARKRYLLAAMGQAPTSTYGNPEKLGSLDPLSPPGFPFLRISGFLSSRLLRSWRLPSPADATQATTAPQSTDPAEVPAAKCLWGGRPVGPPKTSPAQRRSGVLPAAGRPLLSPPQSSRPSPSHATLADSLSPRPGRALSLRTRRGRGEDDPDGPRRRRRLQLWRLFHQLLGKGGGERSRAGEEGERAEGC